MSNHQSTKSDASPLPVPWLLYMKRVGFTSVANAALCATSRRPGCDPRMNGPRAKRQRGGGNVTTHTMHPPATMNNHYFQSVSGPTSVPVEQAPEQEPEFLEGADAVGTMIDVALGAPSGCWGAELSGEMCTPGFAPGQGHFKNKFCFACRSHGIAIPADKICVVAATASEQFHNTNGRAAWTDGARVVNQTAKCTGPRVVIFKDPVANLIDNQLVAPPDEWLRGEASDSAFVLFAVSKGTLVPLPAPKQVENLSLRRLMALRGGSVCSDQLGQSGSSTVDRAALLDSQLTLEQLISRRFDCERAGVGIVDDPLSEVEVSSLNSLLDALRHASSALRSADHSVTVMLSDATLPLEQGTSDLTDGIFSFPPSPPHSSRLQVATVTQERVTEAQEKSLRTAVWTASIFVLGVLASFSAGHVLFHAAPQLEGASQATLMFFVGAFAFNLTVFLVRCATSHMASPPPALWWPGGSRCVYHRHCDTRQAPRVSPSES